MNLRRLKYFLKIVDIGSLTQASEVLHVAQPALSQQLATLEGEFKQKLLVRTQKGVVPTEAGKALYAHAQIILRQFEQAQTDVLNAGRTLAGQVSIGLAPGTAAIALALPLLQAVHARHPEIVLHLNEDFGTTLCDAVRNGRMDMAVFYGGVDTTPGLSFEPLLTEELFVVARSGSLSSGTGGDIPLAKLDQVDVLLPCTGNQLRRYLDKSFASSRIVPHVVAEMESSSTLAAAVASGIGATLLPVSAARAVAATADAQMRRVVAPVVDVPLVLCASDHLPHSEPAKVVKSIILELIGRLVMEAGLHTP